MSLRHWGHGLQRDAKCWCRTRSWKWLAPQGTTEPSRRQGCCMGQSSTSSSALRLSKLVPALGSLPACLPAFAAGMPCGCAEIPLQTQRQRWHLWHAKMLASCIYRSWTHGEPKCC